MWPRFRHVSPPCHLGGIEARGGGPHCWGMSMLAAALVVTIRVYDLYGLSPDDAPGGAGARGRDARPGRRPGHHRRLQCRPGLATPCKTGLAEGEIILRIQRHPKDGAHVLGDAIVRGDAGPNTIATVYAAAIAERSRRTGMRLATIVGRVSAHEIGHLLLGTNAHAVARPDAPVVGGAAAGPRRLGLHDRGRGDDSPPAAAARACPRAGGARGSLTRAHAACRPRVRHASTTSHHRVTSAPLRHSGAGRTLASMSMLAAAAAVLTITVRVYDLYGLPPDQKAKALALAAETLAQANVTARWIDCARDEHGVVPPPCEAVVKPGELVAADHGPDQTRRPHPRYGHRAGRRAERPRLDLRRVGRGAIGQERRAGRHAPRAASPRTRLATCCSAPTATRRPASCARPGT